MSSSYSALCLSHDPAFAAVDDESTWDAALERARLGHPRCDLLIGRWSGALIELCCPGMNVEPGGEGKPHPGWHRDPIWADVGLLRVASVALRYAEQYLPIEMALRRLPMCWTRERLHRISAELDLGPASGPGFATDLTGLRQT